MLVEAKVGEFDDVGESFDDVDGHMLDECDATKLLDGKAVTDKLDC